MGKRAWVLVSALFISLWLVYGCAGGGKVQPPSSNEWSGMHTSIATVWQYYAYYNQRIHLVMDDSRNITEVKFKDTYDVVTTGPTASLVSTADAVLNYERSDGSHWTAVLDAGGDHMMVIGTDCREFAVLQRAADEVPAFDVSLTSGSWTGQTWVYNAIAGTLQPLPGLTDAEVGALTPPATLPFDYIDSNGSSTGTFESYYYWGGCAGYIGSLRGTADAIELLAYLTVDNAWMGGFFGNIGEDELDPNADLWPDEFTLFWLSRQ